jgi:hypothetical protein
VADTHGPKSNALGRGGGSLCNGRGSNADRRGNGEHAATVAFLPSAVVAACMPGAAEQQPAVEAAAELAARTRPDR